MLVVLAAVMLWKTWQAYSSVDCVGTAVQQCVLDVCSTVVLSLGKWRTALLLIIGGVAALASLRGLRVAIT